MSWGFSTSTCTYTGSLTTHFWVVYPIYTLCPLVWNEAANPWFQQLFLHILPLSPMFHKMYRPISAMCHDDICSLNYGLYLTIFSVLWWIASTIIPLAFIATVIDTSIHWPFNDEEPLSTYYWSWSPFLTDSECCSSICSTFWSKCNTLWSSLLDNSISISTLQCISSFLTQSMHANSNHTSQGLGFQHIHSSLSNFEILCFC